MRSGQRTIVDHALVTLTGTVRLLAEPLLAPLSGTPCVVHRSSAQLYRTTTGIRRGRRELVASHVEVEMIDFALETSEGVVLVVGTSAEVTIRPARVVPRQIDREARFLVRTGLGGTPTDGAFDEVVIEPGAKISVHGVARIEADPAAAGAAEVDYRNAPTSVRLEGDATNPLTIDAR